MAEEKKNPAGAPEPFSMVPETLPPERADRSRSRLGLVQVYTGNGKGKTTATLGLALRAAGHGYSTAMVQFLKTGYTGEVLALKRHRELPIEIISYGKKCANHERHIADIAAGRFESFCRECFNITEEDKAFCKEALAQGKRLASSGQKDIVILDEVNVAIDFGLVSMEDVLDVVRSKWPKTELILTGRNARKELIEAADVVNEVNFLKHPYDKGIYARKGIEF